VAATHQVREFAFDLGPVRAVVGLPGRVLLAGTGVLKALFVPAENDSLIWPQ
jgi:hypothetical protein